MRSLLSCVPRSHPMQGPVDLISPHRLRPRAVRVMSGRFPVRWEEFGESAEDIRPIIGQLEAAMYNRRSAYRLSQS